MLLKKPAALLCSLFILGCAQAEIEKEIQTVGGPLGVYYYDGDVKEEYIYFKNPTNRLLGNDMVEILSSIKVPDAEIFLISSQCGGSSCDTSKYYELFINSKGEAKFLGEPKESWKEASLTQTDEGIIFRVPLTEGRRDYDFYRIVSPEGQILKEYETQGALDNIKVNSFDDLVNAPVVAAVHFKPIEEFLKGIGKWEQEEKALDPLRWQLRAIDKDHVGIALPGDHQSDWVFLYIDIWRDEKFFIMRQDFGKDGEVYYHITSNLDYPTLKLLLAPENLDISDYGDAFCEINGNLPIPVKDFLED